VSALLFGSISTIADTSELQRDSFNEAFATHGLDWRWDREEYVALLTSNGGADRVAQYAADRGQDVDAAAVHRTKTELFQQKLAEGTVSARPGVIETLRAAQDAGTQVALVTTTSPENVKALVQALQPDLSLEDFDLVVDSSAVSSPKPDRAAYVYTLGRLGVEAGQAVAVEDNVGGLQAAQAAGIACVAFPNTNTVSHDFSAASAVVDHLDLTDLARFADLAVPGAPS